MKTLIFNGNLQEGKSDTMHITRDFLDGMNEVEKQEVHIILIKFSVLITLFAFLCAPSWAQQSIRVFFAGNSYTQVNDLPRMVADIAQNMGDEMIYASNTPGGCTFEMHCSNASMDKICQGGWDFVVLQEQSQLPAFPIEMVEEMVFPFAEQLVDSIYAFNPDAEAIFFMTWGRKNGDTEFGQMYPLMSTYEGMDSLLYERYMYMAETNDASVCPVGRVWHYLRDNHNEIELYMPDESHPTLAGSYAAACAFYTMLFGRDPDSITYDADLSLKMAHLIRSAVHEVVFDSLWKWQRPEPNALFSESQRHEIYVSPNPTHNEVALCLPEGTEAEMFLFSTEGRIIWRKQANGTTHLSLSGMPSGIYLLKVVTPHGVVVKRIVKQ